MGLSRKGRYVLITGASRGLGAELARAFARRGDWVIGLYRTRSDEAHRVMDEISDFGGHCELFKVDVGASGQIRDFFGILKRKWNTLDILINNAAVVRDAVLPSLPSWDWDEVIKINVTGAFLCMKSAFDLMRGSNGIRQKCILNIGSLAGVTGRRGQANYAASKAALIALTQVAAQEFAYLGIRVNAIIPGFLQTPMSEGHESMNRRHTISEVAQGILFLSDLQFVSGQVFTLEDRIFNHESIHQPTASCRDGAWSNNSHG